MFRFYRGMHLKCFANRSSHHNALHIEIAALNPQPHLTYEAFSTALRGVWGDSMVYRY